MNALRNLIAWFGAQIIYFLICVFGKKVSFEEAPWLRGPLGSEYIGDRPYAEVAASEGLELKRDSTRGGLIPDFDLLASPAFDPSRIHPAIRHFYEHTASHRMDVWPHTYFPANLALWLLVTTISRKVNQLNFPTNAIDLARGMSSEIVLLKQPDGGIKYTGWFRKISESDRVLYTGFYMVGTSPMTDHPCVKVVFPMPDGNATVMLRPELGPERSLILNSQGVGFGDVGFYRMQSRGQDLRIWRIASLKERFRVYVDQEEILRCDHDISFLGFRVLTLHYRIESK